MITRDEFRTISGNGIWKQNTSIVQILGLCPLLAVTTNAVNGIMLSLATIIVMAMSGFAIASLRNLIPHEIRIPVFILIVAALNQAGRFGRALDRGRRANGRLGC